MKKMRSIAAVLLVLALLLTGCAAKEEPQPTALPQQEAPQPTAAAASEEEGPVGVMSDFTATDLDGNAVTAQDAFSGYEMTMVNVWGTFCGPCIKEMPDLGELSDELAEKNIRIVGLVSDAMGYDGTPDASIIDAAKEIVSETGADYLHIVPSPDLMGLLYQIQAVPTTFFVDEYGCQVGYSYAGAKDKDDWMKIVEETLALKE